MTKHTKHQCTDCQEKLPAVMEQLKHVSKYDFEEQVEVQEEEIHKQIDHIELKEKVNKSVFVFGEATLDKQK